MVTIGNIPVAGTDNESLDAAIKAAGYDLKPQTPPFGNLVILLRGGWLSRSLAGMTFGPVAALLAEMFPPAVRYSSMSIPYHIGTGYFGGFPAVDCQLHGRKVGKSICRSLVHARCRRACTLLVILWGEGRRWNSLDAKDSA